MNSMLSRMFVWVCALALLSVSTFLPQVAASAAAPLPPADLPACGGAVSVPIIDAPCKDMKIIFLVDDSGSMDVNDPDEQRFASMVSTIDLLAEVYLSQSEAGARELPKIHVAAVHFATQVIASSGWLQVAPSSREAWESETGLQGEYQAMILEQLIPRQVRVNPDRRTDFSPPFREAVRLLNEMDPPNANGCPNRLVFVLTDGIPDKGQGGQQRLRPAGRSQTPAASQFAEVRDLVAQIESPVSIFVHPFHHSGLTAWNAAQRYWLEGIATQALQVNLGDSNDVGELPNLLNVVRYKVEQELVGATVSVPAYLSAMKIMYSAPHTEARLEVLDPQGKPLVPTAGKITLTGLGSTEQEWTVLAPLAGDYSFKPLDQTNAPLPGGSIQVQWIYPPVESGLKIAAASPPLQQYTRGNISFRLLDQDSHPFSLDTQHPPRFNVSLTAPGGEPETKDLIPKHDLFSLTNVLPLSHGTGAISVRVVVQGFDGSECLLHQVQEDNDFQVEPVRIVAAPVDTDTCTPSAMPVRFPLMLVDSRGSPTGISLPIDWEVRPVHASGGLVKAEVRERGGPGRYEFSLDTQSAGLINTGVTASVEHNGRTYPLFADTFTINRLVQDQAYSFEPVPNELENSLRMAQFGWAFPQTGAASPGRLLLPRRWFGALGPSEIRLSGRFIDQKTGQPAAGIERFRLELVPLAHSAAPLAHSAPLTPLGGWQAAGDGTYFASFPEPPLGSYELVLRNQGEALPCTQVLVSGAGLTLVRSAWEYLISILLLMILVVLFFIFWFPWRRSGPDAPVPAIIVAPTAPTAPGVTEKQDENEKPPDDLTILEGIGPKVAALLSAAGITTFQELALAAPRMAEIRALLRAAGYPYMFPDTWPEQAQRAAAGDWDGLQRLMDELKAGRRIGTSGEDGLL